MTISLKIRYYKCCYYNRIDINEDIDPTKSNRGKECMIHRYMFFNHKFKFQDSVCNDCHDLTKLCVDIINVLM